MIIIRLGPAGLRAVVARWRGSGGNGAPWRPVTLRVQKDVQRLSGERWWHDATRTCSPARVVQAATFHRTESVMPELALMAWPQWSAHTMDAATTGQLWECLPIIPFCLLIPWDYVWREYVAAPVAPWRRARH